MERKPHFEIKSVVRIFKLIELIVTESEFELAELARLLRFPKTTVQRMLLTLEKLGYVERNPATRRYMACVKFFELGAKVIQRLGLVEIAHPLMIRLSDKSGETINLGILDGLEVVCIDKVESKRHLKHDQPIGSRHHAYCTAFGKAILAFLPEEERERLFSENRIVPSTSKSFGTVAEIQKDLRNVRQRGYSVDNEEAIDGLRCVGAPIFDHNGKPVAGISIAGPAFRVTREKDLLFSELDL